MGIRNVFCILYIAQISREIGKFVLACFEVSNKMMVRMDIVRVTLIPFQRILTVG